jgi:hypothetical protein
MSSTSSGAETNSTITVRTPKPSGQQQRACIGLIAELLGVPLLGRFQVLLFPPDARKMFEVLQLQQMPFWPIGNERQQKLVLVGVQTLMQLVDHAFAGG